MNKKFLSAILFGALMVTSTGTFVSCKDYDDDIDAINKELTDIKSQIAALQSKVDAGNYVTNITKAENGINVAFSNGTTSFVETATKVEIEKIETATIVDGEWVITKVDGSKVETGIPASGILVTGDEKEGYVLNAYDAKGDVTTIELPTAASMISEVEFIGWLDAAGNFTEFSPAATPNNKYEMNYASYYTEAKVEWEWKDADASQKYKNNIPAKTAITILEGSSLVVRVAPATVDAADIDFSLVNSKLAEAPIALGTAKAYTGLVTRAASENGLYSIPMTGVTNSGVASDYLSKAFTNNSKQVAFALKASKFVSNFNLVFGTKTAAATQVKLNGTAYANNATIVVDQNKENTFTFTAPTTVYDSKIIVDEVNAQNWGVTIDGNKFTVSNFYDKATIPTFPIYFYYFDLTSNSEVKLTYNVRLARNIAGVTTLEAKAHMINKDIAKDNFSASIKPMYEGMTTEQLNNWKEYVHKTEVAIYQVGVGANGTDDVIESSCYNSITLLNKDNSVVNTRAALKNGDVVTVKVDLNNQWPGTASVTSAGKYSLNGEYYVLVKFEDDKSDVLSTVKLPFTLSIPTFTDIFVHQDGIWVDGVAQAYMYATDVRGASATNAAATYTIKNSFKTLKDNMGSAFTFDWGLDAADANKISGKKHEELATLSATSINKDNVETTTITLNNGLVSGGNNANGTQLGYGKELIINVKNAKYLNKYVYGTNDDVDYSFKLKVMSPLFEGKVYAVDNVVKLDATSLEVQKVNDSHIKAHTYNTTQVYSIFSDKAAPDYWTRPELKSVVFESGNAELFTVSATASDYVPASGTPGTDSYVAPVYGFASVTINQNANISVETASTIKVKVTDAWGYTLTQEVPVVLQVTK